MTTKTLVVLLVTTVFSFADTVTLNPTDDAYILSNDPDVNLGDSSEIVVGFWDGGWVSTLIEFDLSPYEGSTIDGAYLRLYVFDRWGAFPPTDIKLGRNTADWSEDTVTWNNRPGFTDYYVIDSPSGLLDWWVTEVTGYIQGFVDGSYPNYGFRIGKGDTSAELVFIRSKDHGNYTPELLLYYTPSAVESESLGSIKAAFK